MSRTVKARDGDAVLVHSGYHAVVAGPGYDVYYLNFLAGSSRALAVTEDRNIAMDSFDMEARRIPVCPGSQVIEARRRAGGILVAIRL